MWRPLSSFRGSPLAAAAAAAGVLGAAQLGAQELPLPAPVVPVSPTSQCSEGPGAPPADPSKVTRVVPGAKGAAAAAKAEEDLDADVPGKPPRVLLELGASAGVSLRFDDAPALITTSRTGLVLGGSLFAWTSHTVAFGLDYSHAQLDRVETPPLSIDVIAAQHAAHALLAEVRVVPFRRGPVAVFGTVGGGLTWQTAALQATFTSQTGVPGGSFACSAGSDAEFAFRAGVGVKARLGRAAALLADASFMGYRLSGNILDNCSFGAGTAQTLMVRTGITYDLDISRFVR